LIKSALGHLEPPSKAQSSAGLSEADWETLFLTDHPALPFLWYWFYSLLNSGKGLTLKVLVVDTDLSSPHSSYPSR
jgi:hypothetical protein